MLHRRTTLLALAALAGASSSATALHSTAERIVDNVEIRHDRHQHRDDLRDVGRLSSLAQRFDAARVRGDVDALRRVDLELRWALEAQLGEGRVELSGDRAELRRDHREVRGSRAERVMHVDAPACEAAEARHDLRDDRRDRRDDRRDARAEARSLERRSEIAAELADLFGNFDENALDRKRTLLRELIAMAEAETAENEREWREDRGERREDRRNGS